MKNNVTCYINRALYLIDSFLAGIPTTYLYVVQPEVTLYYQLDAKKVQSNKT